MAAVASATLLLAPLVLVVMPGLAQTVGTVSVLGAFLAWLTISVVSLRLIYASTGIPLASILVLFALILSALGWNNNHKAREVELPANPPTWDAGGPQMAFTAWLSGRGDLAHFESRQQPYPVFVVAARGGGLYAAEQAATFLSRMQDRCPTFSQHIFAISSVSGGSMGSAAFAAYSERHVKNAEVGPCYPGENTWRRRAAHS